MSAPPHLSLQEWSCLRTELVWIYDHAPLARSRRGVFDHGDSNWAWYLRRGEVRVTTKAGELVARAGQWLFLPMETHRHEFSADAVIVSVRFRCLWPSGENIFREPAAVVLNGTDFPRLEKTARRLALFARRHFPVSHHEHARQAAEYPFFLRLQRLFSEWLEVWFEARVASGAKPARHAGDERAARVARVLDEAPMERGFPAEAARRASGVGAVQLGRLFRRELGLSPLQYWERRRLAEARLYLEAGELPLKEVAARLGFRGDSHFNAWFKRSLRMGPGAYRSRSRHA